jgi:peptidoglycan/xylan/chitin deacetylase (PgdA/CDA1 family)
MTSVVQLILCFSLIAGLACKPKELSESRSSRIEPAVILCFHDIGRTGRYAISLMDFRAILRSLAPYRVVSLRNWIEGAFPHDKRRRVVLTFDDGYRAHRELVLPELMRLNYGGTFYFYNDQLSQDRIWQRLVHELPDGIEYGSHSWSHSSLQNADSKALFRELYLSREHLQQLTGKQALSFAWPYGAYGEQSARAAHAAGFRYLVSVDYRIAVATDINGIIPRYTVMGRNPLNQVKTILARYEKTSREP